ncbi:MAG: hypothetical protein F4Y77_02890 [Holophagales bacterium]|nr:hypothetical protein [Holophagales bacterium]
MTSLTLREHVAEPANLWIRRSFSRWPAVGEDGRLCCDFATGGLRTADGGSSPAASDVRRLVRGAADVVYVPPLPAECAPLRAAIVEAAAAAGAPLVLHVVAEGVSVALAAGWQWLRQDAPHSPLPASGASPFSPVVAAGELPENATVAVDLLDCLVTEAALLREKLRDGPQPDLPFAPVPARHATLVWPLVGGWTDQPGVLETAMPRFAAAGARRVVPRAMTFDARERHLLAERLERTWPEAFDAVFHGDDSPPDEAAFRSAAEAAGLEHHLPRPLPAPPLPARLRLARELAGHLIELGDLAVTGGDAYYRAARFLDRDEIEIEAAAREGNLDVLPWLEDPARLAVEQWLTARRED